jgi:hypothetical protein
MSLSRCPACAAAARSPRRSARASSSRPRRRRRPSRLGSRTSVNSVLPSRLSLLAMRCPRRRRGCGRSSGSCARAGSPWRPESPSRSAGCCRPRRRASHRSTGRRRRRSRCCACPARAAAATDIARRWCPDTRRPACSGSGADSRRARRGVRGTAEASRAAGRRSRRRSAPSAAPGRRRRAPPLAVGEDAASPAGTLSGVEPAVLPAVDHSRRRSARASASRRCPRLRATA